MTFVSFRCSAIGLRYSRLPSVEALSTTTKQKGTPVAARRTLSTHGFVVSSSELYERTMIAVFSISVAAILRPWLWSGAGASTRWRRPQLLKSLFRQNGSLQQGIRDRWLQEGVAELQE